MKTKSKRPLKTNAKIPSFKTRSRTLRETARRAVKVLEAGGWCKGWFARDKNNVMCDFDKKQAVSFCIIGSIERANATRTAYRAIRNRIKKVLGINNCNAASWNDHKARSKDEVIAVLKKAGGIK